ncbi:MAG: hypothetical protein KJ709_01285 [Nanoarchaeota archaeon]|nr:hypothetical protein [Nanoarchaeota archaeon]
MGKVGPLLYVVANGKELACLVWCKEHNIAEKPGPVKADPYSNRTVWDSRRHGITWDSQEDVIAAIAEAYGLMDHNIGEQEEWHAEPLRFEKGSLMEKLDQSGHGLKDRIVEKNSTRLTGTIGDYGLKISVGGWGYEGGVSLKGLEVAAALEMVANR